MANNPYVHPSPEDISKYEKMLGVGSDYKMDYILECFKVDYDVKNANGKLDTKSDMEALEVIMNAKDHLCALNVSGQKKKYGRFLVVSPFDNTCPSCNGAGVRWKFFYKKVDIKCHKCSGKGSYTTKCTSCKGSGRFKKVWKSGGGIDVTCNRCNGTGNKRVKCVECLTTGIQQTRVQTHKLESTTPCSLCGGLGFYESDPKIQAKKKPEKKHHEVKQNILRNLDNPVFSESLAAKIKESMIKTDAIG